MCWLLPLKNQRLIPEEKREENRVLCWCCLGCLFPLQSTPRATCWQGTEERKPPLGSKFLTLTHETPIIESIISVTTENHDSASLLQERQQTENLCHFCTVYNKQSAKDLNLEGHSSGICTFFFSLFSPYQTFQKA